jgi:hypothetical protein
MSFVIRQIAKRADGSDLVRTRTVVATELSIGRGTDCDIQLSDLGVMLRHARLLQLPNGQLSVEALGGVPVEIEGKFVTRADLDVAGNPVIDIGSHRLSISPGDDGAIALTAERVIPPIEAADAAAETEIFSLGGAMPSKRRMAWAGALAVLVLLFLLPLGWFLAGTQALPADVVKEAAQTGITATAGPQLAATRPAPADGWKPDTVWSSGPLSNAHAALSNNCGACHQKAFVAASDAACQACHKPDLLPNHAPLARLQKGRAPETGLVAVAHQGLNLDPSRCTSCHKEHDGPTMPLNVATSFCTDCHQGLKGRLPDTSLANVPDWPQHPEFRPLLVAQPALDKPLLHRVALPQARDNPGLIYPHDIHQSASNAVANMARAQGLPVARNGALPCSYCHQPDSDGIRFKPIAMEKNCGACHDLAFARDGGIMRTLPHGKPEQVAGMIRDFYLSLSVAPRTGVQRIAFERRQPGQLAAAESANLAFVSPAEAQAQARAAVVRVFSKGGVCSDCHAIADNGSADLARRFTIMPVTLTDHFLTKGRFPHKAHRSYDLKVGEAACVACHTGALKSKLASDVLVPDVASCRECHGRAPTIISAKKAPDDCTSCHGFHEGAGGHPLNGLPAAAPAIAGHSGGQRLAMQMGGRQKG